MADTTRKEAAEIFVLPEGRVINHSLFEMDAYKDPETGKIADPSYKIEMAFDAADVTGENTFEDKVLNAVEKGWPGTTQNAAGVAINNLDDYMDFCEGKPSHFKWAPFFRKGDRLSAARVAKGKEGDAYAGKLIVRAHSVFNKDAVKGPGGMPVHGPDLHPIGIAQGNTAEVFNGCYGHLAVTLGTSEINGNRYVTAYIKAFQKTRGVDADRLAKGTNTAGLFKPIGGAPGSAEAGVRRRRPG